MVHAIRIAVFGEIYTYREIFVLPTRRGWCVISFYRVHYYYNYTLPSPRHLPARSVKSATWHVTRKMSITVFGGSTMANFSVCAWRKVKFCSFPYIAAAAAAVRLNLYLFCIVFGARHSGKLYLFEFTFKFTLTQSYANYLCRIIITVWPKSIVFSYCLPRNRNYIASFVFWLVIYYCSYYWCRQTASALDDNAYLCKRQDGSAILFSTIVVLT